MNNYFPALQCTCDTGRVTGRCHQTEISHAHHDGIAIMDIANIDACVIILSYFHALGKRHRFSFYTIFRIDCANRVYTFISRQNGGDRAVFVILEFFYSHTTAETSAFWQFAGVVEEIRMSIKIGYAAMIGKTRSEEHTSELQ